MTGKRYQILIVSANQEALKKLRILPSATPSLLKMGSSASKGRTNENEPLEKGAISYGLK
jgi:hypothetical protein